MKTKRLFTKRCNEFFYQRIIDVYTIIPINDWNLDALEYIFLTCYHIVAEPGGLVIRDQRYIDILLLRESMC